MLRTALSGLVVALLLYAVACLLLYLFQRSLLYFPQSALVSLSALALSVPGAELQVSVQVHAGLRAVLYFGGNAEDVSSGMAELAAAFPEHAVYAMHYRGYGRSTGKPTEAALHSDAIALHDEVIRRERSEALVARFAPGVAAAVLIPEADHDTLNGRPGYEAALTGSR